MTGEHIWSAWIGPLLNASSYNWRYTDPKTGKIKLWKSKSLDQTAKVVCKACNEGWMSNLESESKATLSVMIRDGVQLSLLPRAVATFAAFAFKNAIIANYMNPHLEPFFTPAVRHHFKSSLEIPNGIQMWLAMFSGTYAANGVFIGYTVAPNAPKDSPWHYVEFYVFTFVAGRLAFQVMAPRWTDFRLRGNPLPIIRLNEIWDTVAPQFWPSEGLPVSWPPLQDLSDDSIQAFTNRGSRPIRVS
jgi:hypothetical protein